MICLICLIWILLFFNFAIKIKLTKLHPKSKKCIPKLHCKLSLGAVRATAPIQLSKICYYSVYTNSLVLSLPRVTPFFAISAYSRDVAWRCDVSREWAPQQNKHVGRCGEMASNAVVRLLPHPRLSRAMRSATCASRAIHPKTPNGANSIVSNICIMHFVNKLNEYQLFKLVRMCVLLA